MIRRGRHPKTGRGRGRPVKDTSSDIKVGTLNFPVTKEDEKPVECKKCGEKMTLRQFRIHNITQHYNLAVTTDDDTDCDHNFFARKLKELSRLMKISVYTCPNEGCDQTYKSALGLGYHLMACGRAEEEIVANSVECDICGKLCLVSNINWHRRLHDKPKKIYESPSVLYGKRQSAKNARALLKKATKQSDTEDGGHEDGNESGSDTYEPDQITADGEKQEMDVFEVEGAPGISEIAAAALRKLRPLRKNIQKPEKVNILDYLLANPLQNLKPAEAYLCLPGSLISPNVKVSARAPTTVRNAPLKYITTEFHRLKIFESEVADSVHGINLVYCGGPISAIAWTSTGTFMAASTLRDLENPPLFSDLQSSPCNIQVYQNLYTPSVTGSPPTEVNGLELKFVIGIANGYVHHLMWSSYSELKETDLDSDVPASEVVGHIAYAAGDSSIGIVVLTNEIFRAASCFAVPDNSNRRIPFYKTTPEMKLSLFEANVEGNESGSDTYEPDQITADGEKQEMDVFEVEGAPGISEIAAAALRKLRPLRKNIQKPEKVNILDYLLANPLQNLKPAEAYLCLPGSLISPNVKVSARAPTTVRNAPLKYITTEFHRLKIFESEVADSVHGINLVYCGGPISAIAWTSTGTFMAASTLRDLENPPLFSDLQSSPCNIQVYQNLYTPSVTGSPPTEVNGLELKFVIGIANGYVHHLMWSSYSELKETDLDSDVPASEVVGHIAYAAGDSSIGIVVLTNEIFRAASCFAVPDNSNRRIPFYKTTPEMKLSLFEANVEPGQCVRFDWSSSMEYIAAGYGSGLLAVFNLKKVSRLLNKTVVDEEFNKTVELKPIWVFQAHTEVISVVQFCADDSNFLMTGSHDYSLKFWDVRMRTEIDSKKLGMIIDANWLEKWTHVAVSLEFCNLAIQIATGTMVKFLPVGSSKGVTNLCHAFNVTSLAFHKGMIAEATEMGNIAISYYDSFSRECDYDRNKRKQNAVNFSSTRAEDIPGSDEVGVCFTYDFDRKEATSISTEPSKKHVKDLTLNYHKLRINKISWCPTGKQMAVAYQNGCLVLIPVTFEKLFGRQTWTPPQ